MARKGCGEGTAWLSDTTSLSFVVVANPARMKAKVEAVPVLQEDAAAPRSRLALPHGAMIKSHVALQQAL